MQELALLLTRIQRLLRWMYSDMQYTEEDFLAARDVAEQLDHEIDHSIKEVDDKDD